MLAVLGHPAAESYLPDQSVRALWCRIEWQIHVLLRACHPVRSSLHLSLTDSVSGKTALLSLVVCHTGQSGKAAGALHARP